MLGDYAVGTNHVLPTGGLARAAGGLGLEAFLKPIQFVRATREGVVSAAEIVGPLARVEGLPLHAARRGGAAVTPAAVPLPAGFEALRVDAVVPARRPCASTRTCRRSRACRRCRSPRASRA